tara:strand:- start:113 stop:283 length:171 start_codon:yes stop_codon:yes gene_type:complete
LTSFSGISKSNLSKKARYKDAIAKKTSKKDKNGILICGMFIFGNFLKFLKVCLRYK